jgi:DNA-binding MurR/RpiR family transcriptional regulator
VIAITDGPLSPLKEHAKVCLELADDSSKPFRSLVVPLCLAQALVVSTGHQLAEQGAGKPKPKTGRQGCRQSARKGAV